MVKQAQSVSQAGRPKTTWRGINKIHLLEPYTVPASKQRPSPFVETCLGMSPKLSKKVKQ